MKCTSCLAELAPGERVCKSCGHPVSNNPTLEDLYFSRLVSNTPPDLVQKVRSATYLTKERRTVTAVMLSIANLESFNAAVPEPNRSQILTSALDQIAGIVYQFEGHIAKLWENSVLAFFGAPVTHEDDPLRAVHAAGSILTEIKSFSDEIETQFGVPFQLFMVLNTGTILIGEIKSNLKFDFQSIDGFLERMDCANELNLPRCKTVLFEDTYRFIKPFAKCTPLEDLRCEDAGVSSQLWRVDHITRPSLVSQRTPGGRDTPLVGRQKELALLMELSETVLAGLGRVGLILGDPGIGKSRLVLEWKRQLKKTKQPTEAVWIEAHGLSFGRDQAYHLLRSLLRATFNIADSDTQEEIRIKIEATLDDLLGVNKDDLFDYLVHLLDIKLDQSKETRIHQLNANELRSHYLAAIKSLLQALALEHPLIIILEDLHWADVSSVDILSDLLPITTTSPILICLISRPDRDSNSWPLINVAREQIGPRLTEISLKNLGEIESQVLIGELIDMSDVPGHVRNMVLEKSEGNPFFIEELIHMLINEHLLVRHDDRWTVSKEIDPNRIPDSLLGLLIARIDRLPSDARLTLRMASVIGRTFREKVIEHVLKAQSPDIQLMEQLSTLESIGMIRVAQVNPELSYTFQHILLHDAAYRSIVEEDRINLHLTAGEVLEELYPDQKDQLSAQLAHHFTEGKAPEKAIRYLDLAGHIAMDSFANAEAEQYFRQAVSLTKNDVEIAHLMTDLGEAQAQQGKHREAVQTWKKAIRIYKQLGNTGRLARVYAWSARSAWWGYDPKQGLAICLDGLDDVKDAPESADIAYLIHETGRAYLFNKQPEKAQAHCEQALEMAMRLEAYDVQAESLATMGILPNIEPEMAVDSLEKALEISETHNLIGPAWRAYINLAAVIDPLGEVRRARDYRQHAVELGDQSGGGTDAKLLTHDIALASLWLADFDVAQKQFRSSAQTQSQGDAYLDDHTLNQLFLEGSYYRLQGQFSKAMDIFNDLIDRSRQVNDDRRILEGGRALAEIILEAHLLEDENSSLASLDIALGMIEGDKNNHRNGKHEWDVSTLCVLGIIQTLRGDSQAADAALSKANAVYEKHPVMQDQVWILICRARMAFFQNQIEPALLYLNEALNLLVKTEGRWWQARVWLEIGMIHLKRNEPEDVDQAQSYFRDALGAFRDMGVAYYPDVIIEKLRLLKRISKAQAIAHRKVTQELAQAGRVQNSFIPTTAPVIPGYEISGMLLPAHETSGDFYDFFDLGEGKLGVVIADVGDKGAGAALYMAMSRTLIRTYATEGQREPQDVIREVNRRILTDTARGIFLTAVFGILDPASSTFTYINAGHNPPCLLSQNGSGVECEPLEKTGTLLGIFTESTWKAKTITLSPGQTLFLYTDGITEAQDKSGAFYGYERLQTVLKDEFGKPAEDLRNRILGNVQSFTGLAPRLDDVTLIVIRKE
ncbi:SpoIIE family protein phosphatase [bacterium]|nr:SpoIIE family protein phosphatase [bacterium]